MHEISRLRKLYSQGGIPEVLRGVRDFFLFNTPASKLYSIIVPYSTLSILDVNVKVGTPTEEAVWRAFTFGEFDVHEDFVKRLNKDDIVWDVGANLGSYSLLAAALGAQVVSFEPGTNARSQLIDNIRRNGFESRIRVAPFALSDTSGMGVLTYEKRSGIRRLIEDGNGEIVPVRRGDELDVFPSPDVIKVDVEGSEIKVLRGIGENLLSCRLCYVEIHEGVDKNLVKSLLQDADLTITQWFDSGTILRAEKSI